MKHNLTRLQAFIGIAVSLLIFQTKNTAAEDVYLNPGYISGQIGIVGSILSSANLEATSGGYTANIYGNKSGSYTLTVNTPENGSLPYNAKCIALTDSGKDYLHFPIKTVNVTDGQTTPLDFIINPGTIKGTVSTTSGCTIKEGRVYAGTTTDAASGSARDSNSWNGSRTEINSDGTFEFPVVPGQGLTVGGKLLSSNGDALIFDSKKIDIVAGQTVEVNWSINCLAGQLANVHGKISLNGANKPLTYEVKAKKTESLSYQYATIQCGTDGCTYSLNNLSAGRWYIYAKSISVDNDDKFSYPYVNGYMLYVDVTGGADIQKDIVEEAAFINGTINLTGIKKTQDLSGTYSYLWARGSGSEYGGISEDYINPLRGEFDLITSAGDWYIDYLHLFFNETNVDNYLYAGLYIYEPQNKSIISLLLGKSVDNQLEYATGIVTVRYTVENNGTLSKPYLSGYAFNDNGSKKAYAYAYGRYGETQEGEVRFVGIPGKYNIKATAYVGGTQTTFGNLNIEVIPNGSVDLDIGSPALSISEPQPEKSTTSASVLVRGIASDSDGVKNISVNNIETELTFTNNPNDSNEVAFSQNIDLVNGANTITITATDYTDKSITSTRQVYRDNGPPTMTWTPENNSVAYDSIVTIRGTASDDDGISAVLVNGASVNFISTNNPNDPKEVEFSVDLKLAEGSNQVVVSVSDNCQKSISETHLITKLQRDLLAPQITCPANLAVAYGNAVNLGTPTVSDNMDPAPSVTNNAPTSYDLGSIAVTWTATDNSGNKSSCTQMVKVDDKQPPALTCPADIKVNEGQVINLGQPQVSDNHDKDLKATNNAPAVFANGRTTVTWSVTDLSGNRSTCNQVITVIENLKVAKFSVKPSTADLWPPNHQYVTVTVAIQALTSSGLNLSDKVILASVTSDEAEDAADKGDGSTIKDIIIVDKTTVKLRAERLGNGDGRVYTFNYKLTEGSNTLTATAKVGVPQSVKGTAIDSGIKYTVTK